MATVEQERQKNNRLRWKIKQLERQLQMDRQWEERKLKIQCRMAALDWCLGNKSHWHNKDSKLSEFQNRLTLANEIADFIYSGQIK